MPSRPLRLLAADTARAVLRDTRPALSIDARLTSYRSLPLSCVREITVAIDGDPVPAEDITLVVDGHAHRVRELAERIDLWWYVLDAAELVARLSEPLAPGTHTIEASMTTIVPFTTGGRSTSTTQQCLDIDIPFGSASA